MFSLSPALIFISFTLRRKCLHERVHVWNCFNLPLSLLLFFSVFFHFLLYSSLLLIRDYYFFSVSFLISGSHIFGSCNQYPSNFTHTHIHTQKTPGLLFYLFLVTLPPSPSFFFVCLSVFLSSFHSLFLNSKQKTHTHTHTHTQTHTRVHKKERGRYVLIYFFFCLFERDIAAIDTVKMLEIYLTNPSSLSHSLSLSRILHRISARLLKVLGLIRPFLVPERKNDIKISFIPTFIIKRNNETLSSSRGCHPLKWNQLHVWCYLKTSNRVDCKPLRHQTEIPSPKHKHITWKLRHLWYDKTK